MGGLPSVARDSFKMPTRRTSLPAPAGLTPYSCYIIMLCHDLGIQTSHTGFNFSMPVCSSALCWKRHSLMDTAPPQAGMHGQEMSIVACEVCNSRLGLRSASRHSYNKRLLQMDRRGLGCRMKHSVHLQLSPSTDAWSAGNSSRLLDS